MDLYGYMDAEEREFEAFEAVIDNKMRHLDYEFEVAMLEHKERINMIDMKVLFENGTDSDLMALYEAEQKETQEKSKGIFGKIFQVIKNILHGIKKFLFGDNSKEKVENIPDDKEVEVPVDPEKEMEECNGIVARLKNFLSGGGDKAQKRKNLGKVGAVVGTAAVVITGLKLKKYFKDLPNYVNQKEKEMDDLNRQVENADLDPEDQQAAKKELNRLQKGISNISNIFKSALSGDYKKYHKEEEDVRKHNKENQKLHDMRSEFDGVNAEIEAINKTIKTTLISKKEKFNGTKESQKAYASISKYIGMTEEERVKAGVDEFYDGVISKHPDIDRFINRDSKLKELIAKKEKLTRKIASEKKKGRTGELKDSPHSDKSGNEDKSGEDDNSNSTTNESVSYNQEEIYNEMYETFRLIDEF